MVHPKIQKLLSIPQFEQRSPEWFAQRKDKLTSSDAASVLGTNPYSTKTELLYHKCGLEKPFTSNVATLHGQKYEDTAIELYCRITGKVNYNFGLLCYQDVNLGNPEINLKCESNESRESNECNYITFQKNPEYNFLAGSPDGIAESIDNPDEEPILLEVKCPYRRKIKDGYIPIYYYPQVQLNLLICDLSVADFIEYCPKTSKLNIVRIIKDYDWISKNAQLLIDFWKDVVHYRNIGIEKHPEYLTYKMKEERKLVQKKAREDAKAVRENYKIIELNENCEENEHPFKNKCAIMD
jgi:predicted phage-related endonuclease